MSIWIIIDSDVSLVWVLGLMSFDCYGYFGGKNDYLLRD